MFCSEREAVVLHHVCPCLQKNPKQNGRKQCRAKLITLIEPVSFIHFCKYKKIKIKLPYKLGKNLTVVIQGRNVKILVLLAIK